MKRMLTAVAVLGLVMGAAQADWGGPPTPAGGPQGSGGPPPMPQQGGPNTLLGMGEPANGAAPDCYGLHPRLKKIFRFGLLSKPSPSPSPSASYPQAGYGQNGPAYNPTGYPPGAYGPAQGTLVFPHHTYLRSPRDFFMYETRR